MSDDVKQGQGEKTMADYDKGKGEKRRQSITIGESSRQKKSRTEGTPQVLRVLIPSKLAGAVIGRGGANITRLREDFKANLTLPDSEGIERILTIVANVESVCKIVLDLIPLLTQTDDDPEIRMLVHQSQAGAIIGRAGVTIAELREKSKTVITMFMHPAPNSTERVVSIEGQPGDIINCITSMFELLETSPVKGFSRPYQADVFADYFYIDYGGFGFLRKKRNRGTRDTGEGRRSGATVHRSSGGVAFSGEGSKGFQAPSVAKLSGSNLKNEGDTGLGGEATQDSSESKGSQKSTQGSNILADASRPEESAQGNNTVADESHPEAPRGGVFH